MTNLIVRLFVKNYENTADPKVRESYGKTAGAVGIFCNLLLSVIKIIIGYLSATISIVADGFNNVSDAASSIVTLFGFKLSGKPADKEHPFGHARYEYISGLIVAFLIIFIGFSLFKTSVEKIITPVQTKTGIWSVAVLAFSVVLKLWMTVFNRKIAEKINSKTLVATAQDCINDVYATLAVLVGVFVSGFTDFNIDPIAGLGVAVFIIVSGINLVKETLDPLLGQMPDEELCKEITDKVKAYEGVIGVHDLVVHDYGPGRRFASIHAEVDYKQDIMKSHEICDNIERELGEELGIEIVVHLDPIVTDDAQTNVLKAITEKCVKGIDESLHIHDFRIVKAINFTNLIFDVVVPFEFPYSEAETKALVEKKIKEVDTSYFAVISIDRA